MSEKTNIVTIISIVGLIVIVIAAIALNSPVLRDDNEKENILTASGNAELTVNPDQARIFLNIVTEASTSKEMGSPV